MPRVSIQRLWTEPYRVLFPIAAAVGAGGAAAWTLALAGPAAGLPAPPMRPSDHGVLLLLGAMGSGFLGFLGTAFPRQNQGPLPGRGWVLGVAGLQLGAVSLWVGGWTDPRARSAGLVVGGLLWLAVAAWAGRMAAPSVRRRYDPTAVAVPLGAAVVSLACWLSLAQPGLGLRVALLGGFVPVAVSLLDRMVPFFSRTLPGFDGVRKGGLLPLLAGLTTLRLLPEAQLGPSWLGGVASVGLAGLLLRQAHGWRPALGLRVPLVAVLHLGWMALAVGYLADAASALGLVPAGTGLHAHTLGLVVLLLGFGLRVLRGHGGLPLRLGADGAVLMGLVGLAFAGRVGLPMLGITDPTWMWTVPGGALTGAFTLWGLRWGRLVVRAGG